ncbi:MAG: hypothetical protein LC742_00505 [Acidobacteria bacterium]|nr:hypothetical protein [Acidobacteriota bacterium]
MTHRRVEKLNKSMPQGVYRGGRYAKALAPALLCLLAHAFIVSATHYHRVNLVDSSSTPGTSVSDQRSSRAADNVAGHSQCLLCRLQRGFTTDLQKSTPSVAAPRQALVVFPHFDTASYAGRNSLIRRGRAPPLA